MAHHIRKLSWALAAVLTLSVAGAAAPWLEDFDSYATGSQLHGQGGWKGWDNDPTWTAPTSGAQSFSSPNSAEIGGAADLVHEYGVAGGDVQYRAMQYIPSDNDTDSTYFILLNEYNDGGPYDWSVQINFSMDAGQVISDYGGGATLPIVWDQWVELLCVIDLDANTVTEYYNGDALATHQWDDDGTNALAAVDLYANGASAIFYDDMSLVQRGDDIIPEPTTLGLLALGGLALLRRRRKTRDA